MNMHVAGALSGLGLALGLLLLAAAPVFAQAATVVSLQGTGDVQTSGMATLRAAGDQQLAVEVTMSGLAPNSEHVIHVHSGACEAEGPILYDLPNLRADAGGTAAASATLARPLSEVANGRTYLTVHAEATLPSPTLACGNIAAADRGTPPGGTSGAGPSGAPRTGALPLAGWLGGAIGALGFLILGGGLSLRRRT